MRLTVSDQALMRILAWHASRSVTGWDERHADGMTKGAIAEPSLIDTSNRMNEGVTHIDPNIFYSTQQALLAHQRSKPPKSTSNEHRCPVE